MVAATEAGPIRQRILVVEDEPLIALALESMLSELGFEVAGPAGAISTALEVIGSERIDGAILDVNLGSHRIDTVADVLAARACPFVFMTGYGIPELPARHAGRPVLQKPFRFEELLTALRREFGIPAGGRCGFEKDATLPRGDRRPPACHPWAVPTPGS